MGQFFLLGKKKQNNVPVHLHHQAFTADRERLQVSIVASASGLAAVQQASELQTASRDAVHRLPEPKRCVSSV